MAEISELAQRLFFLNAYAPGLRTGDRLTYEVVEAVVRSENSNLR
jgi:hypothetical protein